MKNQAKGEVRRIEALRLHPQHRTSAQLLSRFRTGSLVQGARLRFRERGSPQTAILSSLASETRCKAV